MKFTITFKDPDGVYESIKNAVEDSLRDVGHDFDEEELEAVVEKREAALEKAIAPWVEYKEYIRVEFDTEAGTATVVKL